MTSRPAPRSPRLAYEPLDVRHAAPLHAALADPRVYAHLGEPPPTPEALAAEFARRVAGPPPGRPGERWVNVAVALAGSAREPGSPRTAPDAAAYIGRLEATLYVPRGSGPGGADRGWGEVAYLFGPAYWGRGYAAEAMAWFHRVLAALGAQTLWAAVAPANVRSATLLARLGYAEVPAEAAPRLGSYDVGDRCFRRDLDVPSRRHRRPSPAE